MHKVAVIGIGRWGQNLVRVFNNSANIVITCSNGNPKNISWLKENYPSIDHTTNLEEVLTNREIEIIVIATSIKTHFDIAKKSLLAGKHVFIEKPLCETYSQAKELSDIAQRSGKILFVGYIYLYHPFFKDIQEIHLNQGIKKINMSWFKMGTFNEDIYTNLASHGIAILIKLFKMPTKAEVVFTQQAATDNDIISFKLDFADNIKTFSLINRVSLIKTKTIALCTEDGQTFIWQDDRLYKLNSTDQTLDILEENRKEPLVLEIEEFLECVDEDRQPQSDVNFGAQVVKVIEGLVTINDTAS